MTRLNQALNCWKVRISSKFFTLLIDKLEFKEGEVNKYQKEVQISNNLLNQIRQLYYTKCSAYDSLKKQFDSNELIIVGSKEIELEKDERITDLKLELATISAELESAQNSNINMTVNYEQLETIHKEVTKNHEDLLVKYDVLNKQRFNLEVKLKEAIDMIDEQKGTIKDLEHTINTQRKQIEQDE